MPRGRRLTIETANADLDDDYAAQHAEVTPGPLCADRGDRHRHGHGAGRAGARLRAVLHHQGGRQGQRASASAWSTASSSSRGGHVKIYSEPGARHDGQALPAARPRASQAVHGADGRAAPAPRAARETILLVEDDERCASYVVTHAARARLSRDRGGQRRRARWRPSAARPHVDLLFTDVVMPGGMNGRELAEQPRSACARAEGAVHVGLHRERHRPPRPAGRRRVAAQQAVPQAGLGAQVAPGARRRLEARAESPRRAIPPRSGTAGARAAGREPVPECRQRTGRHGLLAFAAAQRDGPSDRAPPIGGTGRN